MRVNRRAVLTGLVAAPAAMALPARAAAEPVDLALVLAVDASASISKGTLDFQLRGHAAAFRHPAVPQAIANGARRRIAVMLAQFAGPEAVTTLVPWRVLASADECQAMAATIDAAPGVAMGGSTALGGAVAALVRQVDAAPFATDRRTIDVVSNGFSNAGLDPISARAYAAAAGVTVNALAILDEYDWLERYYADNVIVGDGAFVRTVDSPESFADAFLAKLVSEIV